jgi:tripartite motif-containing protein 2/3
LYVRPICISENINQDVCVSDCKKKVVVVVERSGLFRFAYDGGKIYKNTFSPCELDSDSLGNIAISDHTNNSIHLLDIDGNFIKYLLTEKDGISCPRGLKIDNEDRMWISEATIEYVKIFRYME